MNGGKIGITFGKMGLKKVKSDVLCTIIIGLKLPLTQVIHVVFLFVSFVCFNCGSMSSFFFI